MTEQETPLISLNNLVVSFNTPDGVVQAVREVSLDVAHGEVVAIVGESGCGKSVTCQAMMGLNPPSPFTSTSGSITFDGQNLLALPEGGMEALRGSRIAMIFQDPMTSLNPTMTIGKQVMEGIVLHQSCDAAVAREKALSMLRKVGMEDAEARFGQYPHEFSGGMRQRVMIAIALACDPDLIIADEPTTALDVTIQAQIMLLLRSLQKETGKSVILVTHDLGVVADFADRLVVMYAGKVVEEGPTKKLLGAPAHPYTQALLKAVPRLGQDRAKPLATIEGRPPNLIEPPSGCPFWPRCEHAMRVCQELMPETTEAKTGHHVKCWLQHPHAQNKEASHAGR